MRIGDLGKGWKEQNMIKSFRAHPLACETMIEAAKGESDTEACIEALEKCALIAFP